MARSQGLRAISGLRTQLLGKEIFTSTGSSFQQTSWYSGVPEYWGRDSPYHGGTDFLGTPKNHLDLVAKRPISPHVFEIDHKSMHYKLPLTAVSSITNRATGVMLSVGFGAAGFLSLGNDLGALLEAFKASYPLLVFPAKLAVSFPLTYHYLAGARHLYWDHYKYGNMTDKSSPLELPAIQSTSRNLFISAAAIAAALSVYTI